MNFVDGSRDLFILNNFDEYKKNIKSLVFDLDGTLVDSIQQIVKCTHITFDRMHLKRANDNDIKAMIGKKLQEGLESLLTKEQLHLSEEITECYRQVFMEFDDINKQILFDGVYDTLTYLKDKNYILAIASGRSKIGVERFLENCNVKDLFDYYIGGDEVAYSKPHRAMMDELLKRMNLKADSVMGIGDTDMDVLLFKNSNCYSCAVQSGVWSGDAMKSLNPNIIIKDVNFLKELF